MHGAGIVHLSLPFAPRNLYAQIRQWGNADQILLTVPPARSVRMRGAPFRRDDRRA